MAEDNEMNTDESPRQEAATAKEQEAPAAVGSPEETPGEAPDEAAGTGEGTAEDKGEKAGQDTGADKGEGEGENPDCRNASNVVGIRFPNSGRTYCFCAGELELSRYDRVVVESDLGINIGQVAKVTCEMNSVSEKGLKPVLRKITEADIQQEAENESVKREAREFAVERIKERKLPMKLLYADVTLDRKRFIFYFVADTRIDFRELVKDLASKFRSRIELRQIGVRDAAKMIGGFGVCGQELCCKTWLKGFAPISIKMAKQQDLVLNTCKLSGLCGRLMCCLNYEYEPGGPKRKRPEPRQKGKPSGEAMDKAIDTALGSEKPADMREAPDDKAEAPADRAEAGARDGKPSGPGTEGQPARKKRRRRGGRNRGRKSPQAGEGRGSATQETGQAEAAAGKGGQGSGEGQDRSDKPRRQRRRRRRKPKDKKKEE
jgi:cell fate regulator YaaT (PSP1 superfamily)